MQKTKTFRRNTLVFHYEDGHYLAYVVVSEDRGKFSLALPWSPDETVLRGVDKSELEEVFEEDEPPCKSLSVDNYRPYGRHADTFVPLGDRSLT